MKFNQIDTHIEKYYKVSQPINQWNQSINQSGVIARGYANSVTIGG
jgi:hypothetical protein